MGKIYYQIEEGHDLDYEGTIEWLKFKMLDLKNKGDDSQKVLAFFSDEDLGFDKEHVEKIKQIVLKQVFVLKQIN